MFLDHAAVSPVLLAARDQLNELEESTEGCHRNWTNCFSENKHTQAEIR